MAVVTFTLFLPGAAFESLVALGLRDHGRPRLPSARLGERLHRAVWLAAGEDTEAVRCEWFGTLVQRFQIRRERRPGQTITAAVARSWTFRMAPRRTLRRHLDEAATATWLSCHADPRSLTAAFSEWSTFGRGAVGLTAAANTFYRRAPQDLTAAQLQAALAEPLGLAPCDLPPNTRETAD